MKNDELVNAMFMKEKKRRRVYHAPMTELNEIAERVESHLRESIRVRRKSSTTRINFGRIFAQCPEYNLMFRFKCQKNGRKLSLVIAKIEFEERLRRKGHGTAIVHLMIEIASTYGYPQLMLEAVSPDGMAFGRALGFRKYRDCMYFQGLQ